MRAISILSAAVVCLAPVAAHASPVTSMEWLCASAEGRLVGRVTMVWDNHGVGKSTGLVSFTLKGRRLGARGAEGTHAVSMRDRPWVKRLRQLKKRKARLLVLTRGSKQGYSFDGHFWDTWPTRDSAGRQMVLPLDRPPAGLVSARTGRLLTRGKAILGVCRATMALLKKARSTKSKKIGKAYIKLPASTAAARALKCKKGCTLVVPDLLFPKASKKVL